MLSGVKCYTVHRCWLHMMTSSNGNIVCVTGHVCGEFTGPQVNSPHKGRWRGALMFSLICIRRNGWINNGEAGDLKRHRVHYDVTVMRGVNGVWYFRVNHKCSAFRVNCKVRLMYELWNNSQFKSLLSDWYSICLPVVAVVKQSEKACEKQH